jgi:hypothetical protein
LRSDLRDDPRLNPGNGWVSPLCHEPRVALAVIEGMLAPHVSSGRVRMLRRHRAIAARSDVADRIHSVVVRDEGGGAETELRAAYFLDATENGDLLPLAGVEHVTRAGERAGVFGLLRARGAGGRTSRHSQAGALRFLARLCAATFTAMARSAAGVDGIESTDNADDALQF